MKRNYKYLAYRGLWYLIGLILFFSPFALFQKTILGIINPTQIANIHALCFRVPIANLFTDKGLQIVSLSFVSLIILLVISFFIGPFFCGRLCVVGALPEYLGLALPDKFKIDWNKFIKPIPIRYGFLAGYLITPLLAGSIACAFCNLSFMQKLTDICFGGELGVLGSTTIITVFLWLILFGIFTKGGRGYCNFMCPIGAMQNLIYSISSNFNFTYKFKLLEKKCTLCSACIKSCPMGSLQKNHNKVIYNINNCIMCKQCENVCPKGAINFGRGKID